MFFAALLGAGVHVSIGAGILGGVLVLVAGTRLWCPRCAAEEAAHARPEKAVPRDERTPLQKAIAEKAGTRRCPACGTVIRRNEFNSFYCHRCAIDVGGDHRRSKLCPTCRQPMLASEVSTAFYCSPCGQYIDEGR